MLPLLLPELPFLSPNFGSHMVLQRNKPNTFWGWTKPGEKVTVSIDGKKASGVAGSDGRWVVKMTPPKAGGPYTVLVEGSVDREMAGKPDWATIDVHYKRSATLEDVLVGDVWLCTGQSNMEFGLSQSLGGIAEVAAADQPNLRLFMAPRQVGYAPKATNGGEWRLCNPRTITQDGWGGFSAVGYYFGKKLQAEIGVPIGLVEDCWGGTSAEAWTSAEGLRPLGDFAPQVAQVEGLQTSDGPVFGTYNNLWMDQYDPGRREGWQTPGFDDSKWEAGRLPPGPTGMRRVLWLRNDRRSGGRSGHPLSQPDRRHRYDLDQRQPCRDDQLRLGLAPLPRDPSTRTKRDRHPRVHRGSGVLVPR